MGKRFIIGMDEAGYGPKLGPLVIAATAWSVPETCSVFDFWEELEEVATDVPSRGDDRLHVADSKKVYSPGIGVKSLERSVLGFASLTGFKKKSLMQFVKHFCSSIPESFENQPWYLNRNLELPLRCEANLIASDSKKLQQAMQANSLQLEAIAVDVICPEPFNKLTTTLGNKSELLTQRSLELLKRVCPSSKKTPTQIFADKHGGRNHYQDHLSYAFPNEEFLIEKESRALSSYRGCHTAIQFGVKSEKHFPVALASMYAKYTREICMELFNKYWVEHLPGLKPTKGYPQDAARFRNDVEHLLPELCVDENVFWRNR